MPTLQKRKLRLWEAPKGAGPAPGEGLGWTSPLTSHCLEGGFCRPGPLLGRACRGGLPPTCLRPLPGFGLMASRF